MNVRVLTGFAEQQTTCYRLGERVESHGNVTEIFGYERAPDDWRERKDFVDLIFIAIQVKPEADMAARLIEAIGDGMINPDNDTTMQTGPSYIHLGGLFDSQEIALRFMALGHVLKLWRVVCARELGFSDEAEVKRLAGMGLLYAIGYTGAAHNG